MSKRDYYNILGLSKTATEDEIKKAYRTAAMKFHPDRNKEPGAEEKFKEAKEAYECLSDPIQREQYDNGGQFDTFHHGRPHTTSRTWTFGQNNGADFKDIFGDIFKGHPGFEEAFTKAHAPRQQVNVVTISLQDAYKGLTAKVDQLHTINIPKGVRSGTKFYADGKLFRIDVNPHNKFKRANDDLLVDVEITAIEAMLGLTALLEHLDGSKLQFSIPAGIQNGQIVRLSSKGMKNPENDKIGDVLVRINIKIPKSLTEQELIALKTLNHRDIIDI